MSKFDYDLIVIGAGSGGTRTARISASYGAKTLVVEADRAGGTCVLRGCVPKKLLVYASQFSEQVSDAEGFCWQVKSFESNWSELIKKKNKGSNLKFTKPCQLPKMRDSVSIIRAERLQDQKTPEEFKMVKHSIEYAKKKEEDKAANAPINPPGVPSQLQNRLQNAQLVSGARGGSTAIDPLVKHDDRVIENINKVH